VLSQHPAVRETVTLLREDAPGEQRLTTYFVPDFDRLAREGHESESDRETEQVGQWGMAWDQGYASHRRSPDAAFDITGWSSSYTRLPIPEEEMSEWLDRTVDRILALRPSRVLEIGCGTGMILLRVAPCCKSYHGTDISEVVLER